MRKIYLIGTLHAGYTPNDELKEVLEEIRPNQVLVELPNEAREELSERKIYPTEMVFAYDWAIENNINTGKFDVSEEHSYFNKGRGPEDPEYVKYLKDLEETLKKYSWKEFNNPELNESLEHPMEDVLFDKEQANIREQAMLRNILDIIDDEGVVVIITGAAHLKYFKENLPESILPLMKIEV